MKKKLLLILSVFVLTSCDFLSMVGLKKEGSTETQENSTEKENEDNTQTNTNTNTGTEIVPPTTDDNNQNTDDTTVFSLENWEYFTFHDGREPEYNENWTFYYGTSKNPGGRLWENPNSNYSGPEFIKNCYIVSPTFKSWTKIECRFTFWFSSHQSNSYNASSNQPQFKLESYDSSSKLLETQDIEITRSDVPNNNTAYVRQVYIRQATATHFILRWNNYIPNSQGGYSAILCDVGLRGWPND